LGEFGVTAGWLLVVIGSDFVQRRAFDFAPIAAGLGFALLVAEVLYINQFPDVKADALAGKRTLVVRLGVAASRWGYAAIALLSYGWMLAMIVAGYLPLLATVSLLPAVATVAAVKVLWQHADRPQALAPAIKLTILAAVAHGLLLAAALILVAP
jgi:1,4-dihydroxy-2-naphthoate octaprenyltransferase